MIKKYGKIIFLFCIMILFLVFTLKDNREKPTETKETTPITTNINNKDNTKTLTNDQYEQIIRSFLDSINFAIENDDKSFLQEQLKKDSDFEKEILSQVNKKEAILYDYVVLKEIKKTENNIHTIEIEIFKDNSKIVAIYKIEKSNDKFLIIDKVE